MSCQPQGLFKLSQQGGLKRKTMDQSFLGTFFVCYFVVFVICGDRGLRVTISRPQARTAQIKEGPPRQSADREVDRSERLDSIPVPTVMLPTQEGANRPFTLLLRPFQIWHSHASVKHNDLYPIKHMNLFSYMLKAFQ